MRKIVYIVTNTYPDEQFIIEHEYENFEDAKKDVIEWSQDSGYDGEDNPLYLSECEKIPVGRFIQSEDSLLQLIEENINDDIEFEFEKDEREKALSYIKEALDKIKELGTMKRHCYFVTIKEKGVQNIWKPENNNLKLVG